MINKNIMKIVYKVFCRRCKIVYITKEYSIICDEKSYMDYDSYSYQYVKPAEILTADNKIYIYNDVFEQLSQKNNVFKGLWAEYNDFCFQNRNRQHILHILPKACPLIIKYALGSGEGYKDSEYWSSERKEEWILYLRAPFCEED